MKTIAVIMMVLLMGSTTIAQKIQEKDIPSNVKASFQKLYPRVTKAKWSKEDNNFEVEFKQNKEESSVVVDALGNIVETEVEIEVNQLPKGITEYIKVNYKGQSIKEAAKITDAKNVVTFEAEIKGKDLIFDSTGKFIKETKD